MSRVLSGHLALNFSTWCFGIYETAHRIWLKMLSIALEKERKFLTMLNDDTVVTNLLRLFSFVSASLTSLIKLFL